MTIKRKKDTDGAFVLRLSWPNGTSNLSGLISPERYGQVCEVLDQKKDGDLMVVKTEWLESVIEDVTQATGVIKSLTGANLQLLQFISQCLPALEADADRGTLDPLQAQTLVEIARELMKIDTGQAKITGHPDQLPPVVTPSKPPTRH